MWERSMALEKSHLGKPGGLLPGTVSVLPLGLRFPIHKSEDDWARPSVSEDWVRPSISSF